MAATATIVHLLEVAILLVAFGCSMAAAITIGLTSNQLGGVCVLMASVENNGDYHFTVMHSSTSRCEFCIVTHVVGVLLSLVFILYKIQVLCRGKCEIQAFGRLVVLIVFALMAFFIFVEACIVSVGLKAFCNGLLALVGPSWPDTCAGFQELDWVDASGNPTNGANFYNFLESAEAASWISVLLWLSLAAISMAACCIARRQNRSRGMRSAAAAAAAPAKPAAVAI